MFILIFAIHSSDMFFSFKMFYDSKTLFIIDFNLLHFIKKKSRQMKKYFLQISKYIYEQWFYFWYLNSYLTRSYKTKRSFVIDLLVAVRCYLQQTLSLSLFLTLFCLKYIVIYLARYILLLNYTLWLTSTFHSLIKKSNAEFTLVGNRVRRYWWCIQDFISGGIKIMNLITFYKIWL